MASEKISRNNKYRLLTNPDTNEWTRVSSWTSSDDVEIEGTGKTLSYYKNKLMDGENEELTLAEYNALSYEKKMNGTNYFIKDASILQNAKSISFDNTGTTLTATNVQDAIVELLGKIGG